MRDGFVTTPDVSPHASGQRPSIARLLEPESVTVIGASRDAASLGRRVLNALVNAGFQGPVYPVNEHADELAGRRCYRHVRDLPHGVDLAVIAVPRDSVLRVADECIAAGVGALVVITAGFAETGPEGVALQQRLRAKIRAAGLRMVGPNCMGLINTALDLNASFSPIMPPSGSVALSSQSGALGLTILELARDRQLGLSTFVSVGNKADVSSNDLLEYWEHDPHTSAILLYLESFGNPRKFGELARRIGRTKPIVALKAGRTKAGTRAASSHTAALAATDVVVDALFESTGVIRVATIDEMFDVAACLAFQPLPTGRRIAIVTNAGGPGILAVDACEQNGLSVLEFSQSIRQTLERFLPPAASVVNPVDMVASASGDDYRRTIETVASSEADIILVMYTPIDPTQAPSVMDGLRAGIANARKAGCQKPILACVMTDTSNPVPLRAGDERLPVFAFPENAALAIRQVASYAEWRTAGAGHVQRFGDVRRDEARRLVRGVVEARGDTWLTEEERRRLLAAYGVPVVEGLLARTVDEAVEIARAFGAPVALKLDAIGLLHKSDVGGVRTALRTQDDVRKAAADLFTLGMSQSLVVEGVLVQPMIHNGLETMVGVAHDPLFGSVVGFGLGGTDVELEHDMHFGVVPISDRDAGELIRKTRAYARILPHRGQPGRDLEALTELLLRVSQLADELPEVVELDFNPVMVRPVGQGSVVVDARIRVASSGVSASPGALR